MHPGNPAEYFVDEEIPHSLRHLFPTALRRAYAAADETIDRHSYLATPGGKYQRGDLIMLAASYEFEQLVRSGNLPFEGTWEYFARPTGKHFVMLSARARITVSQVEDPIKKPRHAIFRQNYAENNQGDLFEEWEKELVTDNDRRLLHVLHGYQDLAFIHVTYPHPILNGHVYRTSNLMQTPHEIANDLPPAEGPAESPTPEVLENLERYLHDDE